MSLLDYEKKLAAARQYAKEVPEGPAEPAGQLQNVFHAISEELTNLQQIIGALETRLQGVLLPSSPSTAETTPNLPQVSPYTAAAIDLALRLQATRKYVQDIYNRLDV